jgi:hypothetical protein
MKSYIISCIPSSLHCTFFSSYCCFVLLNQTLSICFNNRKEVLQSTIFGLNQIRDYLQKFSNKNQKKIGKEKEKVLRKEKRAPGQTPAQAGKMARGLVRQISEPVRSPFLFSLTDGSHIDVSSDGRLLPRFSRDNHRRHAILPR